MSESCTNVSLDGVDTDVAVDHEESSSGIGGNEDTRTWTHV